MRYRFLSATLFVIQAALLVVTLPARAQQQASPSGTVPVTTVVTVLGPKFNAPPALGKEDVIVHEDKTRRDVLSWVPTQGDRAALELAIVIDDATNTDFGLQFKDLTAFIMGQSKTARVGVFYADNGTVQAASQFSPDHEAVAKSLRLPVGRFAAYSSIYLSVMDLIKRWPADGARHEILLIADGIDRFRGDFPTSPDVDSTIERAQRAGIMIHTLYASGVGRVSRNMFRINLGQSNLSHITDATGGEAFFQGLQTPISFGPFLEQLDMVLRNQYWLTFAAPPGKKEKEELRRIKITTEQRNAELSYPERVPVPAAAK